MVLKIKKEVRHSKDFGPSSMLALEHKWLHPLCPIARNERESGGGKGGWIKTTSNRPPNCGYKEGHSIVKSEDISITHLI